MNFQQVDTAEALLRSLKVKEENFPNNSVEFNKLAALETRHWKEFTRIVKEYLLQSNSFDIAGHLEEIESSL